jgi:hypothetical protein
MAKLDKLVEQAREHLEPGEEMVAAIKGTYETKRMGKDSVRSGSFLATDRRLVFYGKKLGGYDLESFPYSHISSFEMSKGMMGHKMSFFASGNHVQMKWIDKAGVEEFTTAVRARMGKDGHQAASGSPTVEAAQPAAPDIPDQLRKLGELRDAGILTQEEFDAKKTDLLSRM